MTETNQIELMDLCFAESLREKSRWCPEGEALDARGELFVASATRLPAGPFNAAIASGDPAGGELLDRAREFFGARSRGFTVYVRGERDRGLEARCREEGLTQLGDMPGMVIERAPAAVPGIAVEGARDPAGLATFLEVLIESWENEGLGSPALRKHFAEPWRLLLPHVHVVIARNGAGAPVATALAILSHGVGSLYWVGTVPSHRRLRFGEAVTAETARWCFENGARAVFLQASAAGEPVYRRMGFREIGRYPWFLSRRA
jgi:ribosomal protein S18 acetylase RimI-like enzyme